MADVGVIDSVKASVLYHPISGSTPPNTRESGVNIVIEKELPAGMIVSTETRAEA